MVVCLLIIMLRDSDGDKLPCIDITDHQWDEMKCYIEHGITRKLAAARKMVDIDKELSAGIYLYALEEFGKLLVLHKTEQINDTYRVNYANKFTNHRKKFKCAAEYLQANGYGDCLVLGGGFDPGGYDPKGFIIAMLADFNSRLSIFYADFDKGGNVLDLPTVDPEALQKAIDTLELATNKLS